MPNLSKRRWWFLAVAMVVCLAGAGELLTVAIRGDSQAESVSAAGSAEFDKVVAFGHVDVESRIRRMYLPAGLVSDVLVHEGESVPTGAILVRLYDAQARGKVAEAKSAVIEAKAHREAGQSLPDQYRLKLQQAEAAVRAAQAQRDGLKAVLEFKQKLEHNTVGSQAITIAQYDLKAAEEMLQIKQDYLAMARLLGPTTEIKVLDAEVTRAEALLAQAEAALTQFALVAPTAGTILEITVAKGETLGGASPIPAVQFCPNGPRIVRADIDQASAARVAVGQKVVMEDDTNSGGRWTGRVKWVADLYSQQRPIVNPDPTQYSDVRTMPCIIQLDPRQAPLKINQRVLATIEVPVK